MSEQIEWGGTGPFPKNKTIAAARISQHKAAIDKSSNKGKIAWHQLRINEILAVFPDA